MLFIYNCAMQVSLLCNAPSNPFCLELEITDFDIEKEMISLTYFQMSGVR